MNRRGIAPTTLLPYVPRTRGDEPLGGNEQQLLEYLEGQRVGRLLYREAL